MRYQQYQIISRQDILNIYWKEMEMKNPLESWSWSKIWHFPTRTVSKWSRESGVCTVFTGWHLFPTLVWTYMKNFKELLYWWTLEEASNKKGLVFYHGYNCHEHVSLTCFKPILFFFFFFFHCAIEILQLWTGFKDELEQTTF